MKVVILAGGYGTRISEESHLKPKPMIEVGEKPLLWHIMKLYSHYGFNDFIICCGYKGYVIKEYFSNYFLHMSDITFDFRNGNHTITHRNIAEPWRVTLVDTGLHAMTGARVKKVQPYVEGESFMLTYGDGLSNVDINALVNYHQQHGKLATVTSVQPSGKFGSLNIDEANRVVSFEEKPRGDGSWINGGFFVFENRIFDYLKDADDSCVFEHAPLENIACDGELRAYRHEGFWQPMDTLRDKNLLEGLWDAGNAPWKLWED